MRSDGEDVVAGAGDDDPDVAAEQARQLVGARMRRGASAIQMAGAMDELSLEDAMRAVDDAEEDAREAAGGGAEPCTNDAAGGVA